MTVLFYVSSAVALLATALVVTRPNAVHALMYLVVSLLAVAVDFWTLGAPFIAALEVILYAGAILVLFVFVVMLVDEGAAGVAREKGWLKPRMWVGPGLLALVLLVELIWITVHGPSATMPAKIVEPKEVAVALYGPYLIGVEVASYLLLAGLVGAWHLAHGKRGARQ
jgi:NADH-quinone oxidoreductase subunit J